MKNRKIHAVIGSVICAATVLLFLAFWDRLPETIAIQMTTSGTAGNTLPKPLFVFGLPLIFLAINIFKSVPLLKKDDVAVYKFYIIPAVVVLISISILAMALVIG